MNGLQISFNPIGIRSSIWAPPLTYRLGSEVAIWRQAGDNALLNLIRADGSSAVAVRAAKFAFIGLNP